MHARGLEARPLEDGIAEMIDEGEIGPRDDPKARGKMMAEKYQEDAKKARTWATKLQSKLSKEQDASKDQGSVELLEEEMQEVRGEMRKQTTLLKVKDRLLAESREHHQKGLGKVKAELEDLRQKLEQSEKRVKELGGDSSASGGAKALKKKKKSPYEA